MGKKGLRYSPSFCVTHKCNLNCRYCYQHHSTEMMSIQTAKKVINNIFDLKPKKFTGIDIGFIGGEPLLAFDLIREVCEYTWSKYSNEDFIFYASTNGTILTEEMKMWFSKNDKKFILGLSLDGTRETHNYNRSNSFDLIDIDFFREHWPKQGVKMTLSDFSLENLADNIRYLHSLGFKITGANLAEGYIDWDKEYFLVCLSRELKKLNKYYIENPDIEPCPLLNKKLMWCDIKREKFKYCGIGNGANFYDIDGTMYPCPYVTPMTFCKEQLENIKKIDFTDINNFVDDFCFENCYLYPICSSCAGDNYLSTGKFNKRKYDKCDIIKLTSLYTADLIGKKIIQNTINLSDSELYHTINAIKQIAHLYKQQFEKYL